MILSNLLRDLLRPRAPSAHGGRLGDFVALLGDVPLYASHQGARIVSVAALWLTKSLDLFKGAGPLPRSSKLEENLALLRGSS